MNSTNYGPGPNRKGNSGPISFLVFVFLPIIAFAIGWIAGENRVRSEDSPAAIQIIDSGEQNEVQPGVDTIDVALLKDALKIVQNKFVEPDKIDPEKIKYGIVQGMIWSLEDPYSEFMTPEESADFELDLAGDLEGIGAEMTVRQGAVIVVSPLRNSPAERAGLLPEDIILEVDGEEASGEKFLQVIDNIRGEKGTAVNLKILRPSDGEELELEIVREEIHVNSVELITEDNIAIIEVSQFGDTTDAEFETALAGALASDPRGIILDLRFNSGGYLDKAVDMVSAFQKTGKVVIQKGRPPETSTLYTNGNVKTDLPLVVLQNRGSASASEIVAGALQDLGRAVVIGTQSFGKGTVQELVPMDNGANLRITIAKWLTPNGTDIGKVGITPDLEIDRVTEDFENDRDPQIEAALRYLRGESLDEIRASLGTEAVE
jgi:carboxyl-terminal processing protease